MLRPGAHSRWYPGRSANLVTLTAQKLPHLPFLTEVPHETVARRPLAQPSRHFGPLRSLLLRRGANFEIARATLSALWACQIASRDFGKAAFSRELAQRSCHGEILHRDPYRDLVQHRDLAKRSLTEILPRELSKRDCAAISATGLAKRPFIGSLHRDLAKRPLMEILHGDIA